MLKNQERINIIIERLGTLKEKISSSGSSGLTDIHLFSENFIMEILNIVFDYNLKNLNLKPNNPGLDLGDQERGIAFQVTSQNTSEKINNTLKTCSSYELFKLFPYVKFFILGTKRKNYTIKHQYDELYFNANEDIIDFNDLLKTIIYLDLDKQKRVYDFIIGETSRTVQQNLTNIPRVDSFVGREADLTIVKEILANKDNVVLVNGLGGIGKTTFARELVAQLIAIHHINHVAWISISADLKLEFSGHRQLIESLAVKELMSDSSDQMQAVDSSFDFIMSRLRALRYADYNLLILDNACRTDAPALHLLANMQNDGWKIIVTSREKIDDFEEHQLDVLSADEAISLFYLHYRIERNDDLVSKITQLVGHHSLLIEIISLTSKFYEWTLIELLERMHRKGFDVADKTNIQIPHSKHLTVENINTYLKQIFNLTEVQVPEQNVLRQLCVLPSKDHSLKSLKALFGISPNDDNFSRSFKELVLKGWIQAKQTTSGVTLYNMHTVVSTLIQNQLLPDTHSATCLVQSLIKKLSIDYDKGENPFGKSEYIIYATSVWPFLKRSDLDKDLLTADLAKKMCIYYWAMGETTDALFYGEASLNLRLAYLPENHMDLADMYNNLGLIYLQANNPQEALKYALKDKLLLEKVLEPGHLTLGISYTNLCNIYHRLGSLSEALFYGKQAIEIQEDRLDHDHRADLAISYKNTALVCQSLYHQTGDDSFLKYALDYAQLCYLIRKDVLVSTHPYMASIYYTLATIKNDVGLFDDAEEDVLKSIEITSGNFPNGHATLTEAEDFYAKIIINKQSMQ